MIYLFDKHERFQTIITSESLREAYYEEQLGGASVLRATLPKQDVVPVYVAHRDLVNPQTFMLYKVIRSSEDGDLLTIEAIESAYDDLKADGFVQDYRPNNQLLRIVSDNILEGSRWATGAVNASKTITSSFYYQSRLESILSVMGMGLDIRFRVQITGTEITGRYVDWYDELGADRGKRYVHGGGLLKIDREEERSEIYTALMGRGKGIETYDENGEQTGYGRRTLFSDVVWSTANGDPVDKPLGQAFVEIPERTAEYGYPNGKPRIGILELSDISDPIELLQETYNNLEIMSRPLVHYSADVRDEGTTGLGDTVAIIRGNIRYKTRIFKRTVDLLRPKHVKIELGDKIQSYTVRKLSDLTTKIERSAKEVRLTAFEQVKAYVDQSGGSYWSESGYNYDLEIGNEYGLPAGLYSFDTPIDEAYTKWIYFGAGKLIVSDTKNPDGTWQIKTILDGSGLGADIVGAEQVIAGSLLTDHIKLGSGETLTQGLATFGDTLATHTTNITAQGLQVTSHEQRLDDTESLQADLTQAVSTNTTNITAQGLKVTSHEQMLADLGEAIDSIELQHGEDGVSSFLHIAYADSSTGSGMNSNPAGKTHIGHAVTQTSTRPTLASAYTWSKYVGEDGVDGVKGDKGEDGIQRYTWIRYADTSTGVGISNSPTGKLYIGFAYNQTTATESNTPADYKWSLIKGEKGDQGVKGADGEDGNPTFTWIKYSANSDGTGLVDTPDANTKYIGIAVNKLTQAESGNKADYTWSKFVGDDGAKGDQGPQGIKGADGADGTERWIWIKYADDINGTGLTDYPDGKDFIGVAGNRLTQAESEDPADYTWSRINDHAKLDEAITYYTDIKSGAITLGQVAEVADRVTITEANISTNTGQLITEVVRKEDYVLDQTATQNALDDKADFETVETLSTAQLQIIQDVADWKAVVTTLETQQGEDGAVLAEVLKHMTFDENFLTIGSSNATTQVRIKNDVIEFLDAGEVVAYITGGKLHIKQATIIDRLEVGNHILERHQSSSSITVVRWIGE